MIRREDGAHGHDPVTMGCEWKPFAPAETELWRPIDISVQFHQNTATMRTTIKTKTTI
ncbi:hypothetical protein [Hoeflea sp.]|uniref:hypothetical protein n=1 Tax=Hoeflea sp. TaxID=1940281 RepID=UPI0019ADB47F|nr:hypothetical protein [Hoeflea sp.]MBC7280241.1 hypothetical protein [Hoeflea sp.]